MFSAAELSHVVQSRRSDMGLTQTRLSQLSGLSRATVNQLEKGSIKDLSLNRTARLLGVLGLSLSVTSSASKRKLDDAPKTSPLVLAARTASVSYRTPLPAQALKSALLHGDVPTEFIPHLNTLLEDASVALLASVADELHEDPGVDRALVWSHLRAIARRLGCRRELWQ